MLDEAFGQESLNGQHEVVAVMVDVEREHTSQTTPVNVQSMTSYDATYTHTQCTHTSGC